MSRNPRIRRPGTCGACGRVWTDDDPVLLTRSGEITCAGHRHIFVPEAVVAEGPYRQIRTRARAGGVP